MTRKAISADEFLFGRRQHFENYFIEQTPISEVLCYRNSEGREFDLPIHDTKLALAVMTRLKKLGVKILKPG